MRFNGITSNNKAALYNIMAFGLVQFSVYGSVEQIGTGVVTVNGNPTEPGKFEQGSQVTVTAVPNTGYQFDPQPITRLTPVYSKPL